MCNGARWYSIRNKYLDILYISNINTFSVIFYTNFPVSAKGVIVVLPVVFLVSLVLVVYKLLHSK